MTQEAAVPDDFKQQIRQWIRDEVGNAYRSAPLRSSNISEGGRYTIRGGALVVEASDGSTSAHFGGIYPAMPDGNLQPGFILYREDGSLAAALYDPTPDPGSPDGFKQFFAIYDRGGRIVISDDTSSGQGLARPSLSGGFAAYQFADFRFSTTSSSFVTVADMWVTKQQPRLEVYARASMDTAATTGELRVMVDGVQLGVTAAVGFAITAPTITGAIAGTHMDLVHVEVQGRVTSGSGALRVEPVYWRGRQS